MAVTSIVALSTLGNFGAELSTGDLRQGTAFDTLKATFSQGLKIGNCKESQLSAEYDYSANRDFLKEVSIAGDLIEGDATVSYEVTHDFVSKKTTPTVNVATSRDDTKLGAEFVDMSLTEISAERDVDVGDQSITVQPSWLVAAKTARVKLMSKLGDDGSVSAQVDVNPESRDVSNLEVSYDKNLEDGRDVSATFSSNTLDIDYVDSKTEDDATWTASASIPTDSGADIMDSVKLTLKRAWKW